MKQQKGFTLIELIMVIVILGVLAAFALPRFADLSGNAQDAVVDGARGAVASSSAIARSSALANDVQNNTSGFIAIEGGDLALVFGYAAVEAGTEDFGIVEAAQLGIADYDIHPDTTSDPSLVAIRAIGGADGGSCFTYTEAADANTGAIVSAVGTWVDTDASEDLNTGDTCAGATLQ